MMVLLLFLLPVCRFHFNIVLCSRQSIIAKRNDKFDISVSNAYFVGASHQCSCRWAVVLMWIWCALHRKEKKSTREFTNKKKYRVLKRYTPKIKREKKEQQNNQTHNKHGLITRVMKSNRKVLILVASIFFCSIKFV